MKLSIILPVYNVENYIDDCINSLLDQNIDRSIYEIICVNDGSTDNLVEKINIYKDKFTNIRLIHQENSGVSKARNKGLENAIGEYVWFIDPDDFIESNCLKFIISSLEEYEADILEVSYKRCNENDKFISKNNIFKISDINRYGAGASGCIYIIRKELLTENNIKWNEELSYGEDYLFAFQIKSTKHKNIFTENNIYNYRQRHNSAMSNKLKIKTHMEDMIKLAQIYENEYHKYSDNNIKHNLIQRKGLCIQSVLVDILLNKLDEKEVYYFINKLKTLKLYPYKSLYFNLKLKRNIKNMLISYICFLLNREWYLNLLLSIKKLLYKVKENRRNEGIAN